MEKIIELLNQSEASGWELTDIVKECWEFYFIGHRLDQNRVRDVEHISCKVFKESEDGRFLGSAGSEIAPSASDEEIRKTIDDLVFQASLVKNPRYDLNKPGKGKEASGINEEHDVKDIAYELIDIMKSLPETENEYINSYEIFVSSIKKHFRNSEGIDVSAAYPSSTVEVVVNAGRGGQEIELYRMYTFGRCSRSDLEKQIADTMRFGRDRLTAEPLRYSGQIPVLFSTSAALEIYTYFLTKMNASYVYQGLSDWRPGDSIISDPEGCPLTVRTIPYLDNSSGNAGFDSEGAPTREMTIIDNNTAAAYWGSRQFSQYLGVEDSFIGSNYVVDGSDLAEEALREGKYIEIVEFSDFQVNAMTGDIAGEIRLAYLYDSGSVSIVSGGSISGNMNELASEMRFSETVRQYNNMVIPALTRLENVTLTGAAD